jgi:glycine/D-amino acid oxidase-like deaminating enzyme
VRSIEAGRRFSADVDSGGKTSTVRADIVVNAAGPFAAQVGAMLGAELPIENVYQQKIAFEDKRGVVPRELPFTIDLDGVELDWSDEERALLAEDPDTSWLTGRLPGGVHCRPEGGDAGAWVKLGWAYNNEASEPQEDLANEPLMDPQYPEIVVRAATRLQPSLGIYTEHFPERYSHYGGYYPMTRENWPLVGPMGMEGAFMTGALSGFGSMAACAAGAICASWISGAELPHYAQQLSMARYADADLMAELGGASSRGIL